MTCKDCNQPEHNGVIRHSNDCVHYSDPTDPTTSGEAEIAEMLGLVDIDFGYAVGNLNMDTTPESRKELIERIQAHTTQQIKKFKQALEEKRQVVKDSDQAQSDDWYEAIPLSALNTVFNQFTGGDL